MICLRKHHQCRVIAESIDSMNISHFELLSDLLIAFWERSRSLLRLLPGKPDEFPRNDYQPMMLRLGSDSPHPLISAKANSQQNWKKSINEGLINGSPQVFKKQLFRGVDELGHLDQNQFFKGIDNEVG